jgi:hypothetical protein
MSPEALDRTHCLKPLFGMVYPLELAPSPSLPALGDTGAQLMCGARPALRRYKFDVRTWVVSGRKLTASDSRV